MQAQWLIADDVDNDVDNLVLNKLAAVAATGYLRSNGGCSPVSVERLSRRCYVLGVVCTR